MAGMPKHRFPGHLSSRHSFCHRNAGLASLAFLTQTTPKSPPPAHPPTAPRYRSAKFRFRAYDAGHMRALPPRRLGQHNLP